MKNVQIRCPFCKEFIDNLTLKERVEHRETCHARSHLIKSNASIRKRP